MPKYKAHPHFWHDEKFLFSVLMEKTYYIYDDYIFATKSLGKLLQKI